VNSSEVAGVGRDRTKLFHLAVREEWERADGELSYAPDAFAREGFIHCSYRDQLGGVYDRYYSGRDDLVVLELDRARLEARDDAPRIVEEPSRTGEMFPHVRGRLALDLIRTVHPLAAFDIGPR
jgi:glutathione S-transferase